MIMVEESKNGCFGCSSFCRMCLRVVRGFGRGLNRGQPRDEAVVSARKKKRPDFGNLLSCAANWREKTP
jgi:hypothetical protein